VVPNKFLRCRGYGQNNAIETLSRMGIGEISLAFGGVRMHMDDARLIARFQRLTTEVLIAKRLGAQRPELTDELYQTWLEVDQRGVKKTPQYRNVMLSADRHALWLAGLVRLSSTDAAPSLFSKPAKPIVRLGACEEAADSLNCGKLSALGDAIAGILAMQAGEATRGYSASISGTTSS